MIAGMQAFASGADTGILLAQGINDPTPATPADARYDDSAGTQSYLFASFTFEAENAGTVEINPEGFLLDSSGPVSFDTKGVTITVVPEPGMTGLLIVAGLAALRRRQR